MKKVLRQISLPNIIRQVSSLQKHDKNGKLHIFTHNRNRKKFDKLHSYRLYMISTFLF